MPESRIFANSNLSESPGRTKSLIQHSVSSCASLLPVGGEFAHAIKTPSEAQ